MADVALKSPVADMARHQGIGHTQGIGRQGGGDVKKGGQLDAAQLLQRFVNRRHLTVRQAVAATMAGEMFGHGRHPAVAAQMNPPNIGPADLAHPVRIAAEYPGSDVTPTG